MFIISQINFFGVISKVFLLILFSNTLGVEIAWASELKQESVLNRIEALRGNSFPSSQNRLITQNPDNSKSVLEQDILKEINRARTNPQEYGAWLESLKQYYDGIMLKLPGEREIRTNRGLMVLEEAIMFVKEQSPLDPLSSSENLEVSAKQRVTEFTSNRRNRNLDNISYGKVTPEAIVMHLIVDEGFSDRRHRFAIFNPNYRLTGVACQNDPRYAQVCAIAYEVEQNDIAIENPASEDTTESPNGSEQLADSEQVAEKPPQKPIVMVQEETATNDKPQSQSRTDITEEDKNSPETESVDLPTNRELDSSPPSVATNSILIEKTERGALEPGDKTIPNDGSFYDSYPLEGKAGDSFIITLESQDFDTFLAVMDKDGKIIQQNDDVSDRSSNSRLKVTLPYDGTFNVIVNAYDEGGKGKYVLTIIK